MTDPPLRGLFIAANNPAVTCPDAGHIGQLEVLHPRAVPDQPRDAVGGACRPEERGLVGQPVCQLLDMLDEPGERIPQQFPRRCRIRVSHALTLPVRP